MAERDLYVGSVGPLIVDDADTYDDGKPFGGIRAHQLIIDDVPTDDKHVARLEDLPVLGTTVVTETSFGQSSSPGTSSEVSRADHTHGTPPQPPSVLVGYASPPDPTGLLEGTLYIKLV